MKKSVISLFLIVGLLLSGCSGMAKPTYSPEAFTFTDDLGRTVTVDQPKRMAALLGSFAQIWTLAGGQVVATANDAWEDLSLDLPKDTVNLGSTENLSMELLLAAKPDLVLASSKRCQNVQWMETLEQAGIPVAYFDVADFEDYLRVLRICTQITGRDDLYSQYGTDVQVQIEQIKARRAGEPLPKVLCLVASASFLKAKTSDDLVLGAIARDLGCINIADIDAALKEGLSMEYILQQDPDFIFIVQRGNNLQGMKDYVNKFIAENPAWQQLTAVKNGHVYFMEKELFNLKPNHRWAEAYEKLEAILADEKV